MELRFLGRGAAFHPSEGNTAAFLTENSRMLLVDCGETVFETLLRLDLLRDVKELSVAVSHLHSDHCGSLGSLAAYCHYRLGFPLTVLLPDKAHGTYIEDLKCLLRLYGALKHCVLLPARDLKPFKGFSSLCYVPTVHSPGMECFSLVFETPGGGVFYSADTCSTLGLEAFLKDHPSPEALYMEASDREYPNSVHLSLRQLGEAIAPELRPRTFLMHLNRSACAGEGEAMGFRAVTRIG